MGRKVLETQEGSPSPSRWINRCACVVGFGVGSNQVTFPQIHPYKQRSEKDPLVRAFILHLIVTLIEHLSQL